MAWEDVPAKLVAYDAEEYADNSNGTSASYKLVAKYTALGAVINITNIPAFRREDFEEELDRRLGAVINLRKSRAVRPEKLNGDIKP